MGKKDSPTKFLWRFGLWLWWVSLAIVGCAPTADAVTHPCLSPPEQTQDLPLLVEAIQHMQRYLEAQGMTTQVQTREEGGLMLGAYPRPQALWTIRLTEPALAEDDPRLADIARAAYCLRPGGVWLTITTLAGQTRLMSYPPAGLKMLLKNEESP
jgi:hypothetical protein